MVHAIELCVGLILGLGIGVLLGRRFPSRAALEGFGFSLKREP